MYVVELRIARTNLQPTPKLVMADVVVRHIARDNFDVAADDIATVVVLSLATLRTIVGVEETIAKEVEYLIARVNLHEEDELATADVFWNISNMRKLLVVVKAMLAVVVRRLATYIRIPAGVAEVILNEVE